MGAAEGWFDDDWHAAMGRRLRRAVGLSLALHVGLVMVATVIRLPHQGERPLTSIEVNLASLPAPPVKTIDPPKVEPKLMEPKPAPVKSAPAPKPAPASVPTPAPAPVQKVAPAPPPAPLQKPVPVPFPAPPAIPITPAKTSNDLMRDVMKDIELPPDAPKFGDFSPADKPKKMPLKLPDVPVVAETKAPAAKPSEVKPHLTETEDLAKQLDEALTKIRKPELPKPASPPPIREAAPKPAPPVEAKAPSVKTLETALKAPGLTPGSNAYLARVRQKISSVWVAPPVDVTAQTYVVVIKFRLHRDGSVTGVGIEQSSGNEYYDLAGKRAVVSATPLPAFPADIVEPYFDAHFTFTVGESQAQS